MAIVQRARQLLMPAWHFMSRRLMCHADCRLHQGGPQLQTLTIPSISHTLLLLPQIRSLAPLEELQGATALEELYVASNKVDRYICQGRCDKEGEGRRLAIRDLCVASIDGAQMQTCTSCPHPGARGPAMHPDPHMYIYILPPPRCLISCRASLT